MEERIGSVLIVVNDREQVQQLNQVISQFAGCIIGRQGISMKDRGKSIISLVLEGTTDQLGGLTGQLGRIKGIQVKSVVIKSDKP
jgi:putative iron-only hydrogenase system regulator